MQKKKRVCLSITAHVDAGKTTLAEAMLYEAGQLKKIGRVDHRDSTLDYEDFERRRGITAFSKQAVLTYGNTEFCLIDTPGHADLFAETRRGLRVPDAAVLVISGSEGIQADTGQIWELLAQRGMPVWVFVSKMDLPAGERTSILAELKRRFSAAVTDFTLPEAELMEECAALDEHCMEDFLDTGVIPDGDMAAAIRFRHIIPCFFGSGLRLQGVRTFLAALDRWTEAPEWPDSFSALCYRIGRDARGQRQTFLRVTGGSLRVRQTLHYLARQGMTREEKVTGIRVYTGARYETVDYAEAGQVCAVLGLTETASGTVLGSTASGPDTGEDAVRRYNLRFDGVNDLHPVMEKLLSLSEELPELSPRSEDGTLSVCLSGKMQADMLRSLLLERFGLCMEVAEGRFVYRETIRGRVEGVGHFEPLRHYAEVHLLLEALPLGSGLQVDSICPVDLLDRSWQNLILDTLRYGELPGVLTGAAVTDLRVTLASGRAHPKHTEGGDFQEATRRAFRHGLMQAESVLLEPVLCFQMEFPSEQLGRALSDLRLMHARHEPPELTETTACLTGTAPAAEILDYPEILLSYTHGLGSLSMHPAGWEPCREPEKIIAESNYHPERDIAWPADSVFCSHGAGTVVPWQRVTAYMHLPSALEREHIPEPPAHRIQRIDDRELEEIMLREFGPVRRPSYTPVAPSSLPSQPAAGISTRKRTLLVDGYNFIYAQEDLRRLAEENLDSARTLLMDSLSNYCGVSGNDAVLVFDGYRAPGNPGTRTIHANLRVVFTPEGESADAYLEQLAAEIGRNEQVAIVTADAMIRVSAARSGVLRLSPEAFSLELDAAQQQLRTLLRHSNERAHLTPLNDAIPNKEE